MARATKEDIDRLEYKVGAMQLSLEKIHQDMTIKYDFMQSHLADLHKNVSDSFGAYEKMADKLIQMSMVKAGQAPAAASHRAQARLESDSIPLRSDSQSDKVWDDEESNEEDWAEGRDTMTMQ